MGAREGFAVGLLNRLLEGQNGLVLAWTATQHHTMQQGVAASGLARPSQAGASSAAPQPAIRSSICQPDVRASAGRVLAIPNEEAGESLNVELSVEIVSSSEDIFGRTSRQARRERPEQRQGLPKGKNSEVILIRHVAGVPFTFAEDLTNPDGGA